MTIHRIGNAVERLRGTNRTTGLKFRMQGKNVKTKIALCLLGLVLLTGVAWAQAGTEKAVADLEHKWLESQKTNNPDLIAPYLADKFQMMEPDGSFVSKADYLKTAKATKYSSVDYSDLKVTVFGDTAIATGLYKGKGTAEGKPLDDADRFMDTWVKMPDGKWQCIASANTSIKKM